MPCRRRPSGLRLIGRRARIAKLGPAETARPSALRFMPCRRRPSELSYQDPWILPDGRPALSRIRSDIRATAIDLSRSVHPPIEISTLPEWRCPARWRTEPMGRGVLPCGHQSVRGDPRRGTHQRVRMIVHDDDPEQLGELRFTPAHDIEDDLPFLGVQWRLSAGKAP